ncbi:hypothetical protein BC939DRAFT_435606 [Gamsiella multidivaricata]|uniref:uncharacterized protein n=1 Tax=Gamsiella multidivaricata TaxID=101098 RepID=UPI00221E3D42|nr:uncharacterized protein BC939DRAFT_435606 [Gamsiella multidivaricata]KAI7832481.1 hypothetical protein BC939DRAFT_435606 [Gamsiella multidivaricata]
MLALNLSGLPHPLPKSLLPLTPPSLTSSPVAPKSSFPAAPLSRAECQTFNSGSDTCTLRVFPGTALTQDRAFVLWGDIQASFPNAARLQCGQRALEFMNDAEGNRLKPWRIEYQAGATIQVIMHRASSLYAPPALPPPPPPRPPLTSPLPRR